MYPAVLMSVLLVFAAGTVRLLPFVCVTLIVYGGMLLLLWKFIAIFIGVRLQCGLQVLIRDIPPKGG